MTSIPLKALVALCQHSFGTLRSSVFETSTGRYPEYVYAIQPTEQGASGVFVQAMIGLKSDNDKKGNHYI